MFTCPIRSLMLCGHVFLIIRGSESVLNMYVHYISTCIKGPTPWLLMINLRYLRDSQSLVSTGADGAVAEDMQESLQSRLPTCTQITCAERDTRPPQQLGEASIWLNHKMLSVSRRYFVGFKIKPGYNRPGELYSYVWGLMKRLWPVHNHTADFEMQQPHINSR